MCELDRRVVENVMQHFDKFDSWVINENIESKRLEIVYADGSSFVKE